MDRIFETVRQLIEALPNDDYHLVVRQQQYNEASAAARTTMTRVN